MGLQIDHFVWGTPDLEQGKQEIERLFGVAPVDGGAHPGLGTRNALLGLGDSVYLEILAPQEGVPIPDSLGARLKSLVTPGLITWVARSDNLSTLAKTAIAFENPLLALGPLPTERQSPDGRLLRWELLFLSGHKYGGLLPFFIDWQKTEHPALTAPHGGTFEALRVCSSKVLDLAEHYNAFDLTVDVAQDNQDGLQVQIATGRGPVTLSSTAQTLQANFV